MWPRLGDSSRGVPVRLWINTAGGVSRICLQAGCSVGERSQECLKDFFAIKRMRIGKLKQKQAWGAARS